VTTLHMIRHAAADVDVSKYADHSRMGLSMEGRMQAAVMADRLTSEVPRLEVLFSSPLPRALQTADAIAAVTGLAIVVDDRLAERTFPALYGKTYIEIEATEGASVVSRLLTNGDLLEGYGAPSLEASRACARALLTDLYGYPADEICLVTHGGPLSWLLTSLLEPRDVAVGRKLRFDHGGYTRVSISAARKLEAISFLNRPMHGAAW
jgi:ribonuclease H / adenosylcobalamin/alpha-ribazole phosphatase